MKSWVAHSRQSPSLRRVPRPVESRRFAPQKPSRHIVVAFFAGAWPGRGTFPELLSDCVPFVPSGGRMLGTSSCAPRPRPSWRTRLHAHSTDFA